MSYHYILYPPIVNVNIPVPPLPEKHNSSRSSGFVLSAMAASFPTNQAIVVGGGLGGMSAANTVVENGGRVILLATWVQRGSNG